MKIATTKDVEDAALIARIIGEAEEDHAYSRALICVSVASCATCGAETKHVCGHDDQAVWECIAFAIDASPQALALYLTIVGDLGMWWSDWEQRWDELPQDEFDERVWLESIGIGDVSVPIDIRNPQLEAAGLLEEGVMPVGWKLA